MWSMATFGSRAPRVPAATSEVTVTATCTSGRAVGGGWRFVSHTGDGPAVLESYASSDTVWTVTVGPDLQVDRRSRWKHSWSAWPPPRSLFRDRGDANGRTPVAPPPGFFLSRRGAQAGGRQAPGHASDGARPRARTIAPMTSDAAAPTRVAAPVLLLSGPQRGGQPRGLVAEALEVLPDPRRHVRDHRRRRRLARRHAGASPTSSPRPSRRRPGRPPPDQSRYGAALRSGFGASRYELVAFTDGDRQFKVADLGRLTERLAAAGRSRTSWSATGSSAPTRSSGRSTRAPIAWPTGSSSASRSPTSTAPASSSAARRSRASASSRAAPSSRPSC